MATSWLKPLHAGAFRSYAQAFSDFTNYGMNPEKTNGGELVTGFSCEPETVAAEFMLYYRQYQTTTGRQRDKESDVIAYHTNQSFPHGEVTPEQANAIGVELAMAFTKGKHAFIVSTHVDKDHVHNHIHFCSATLEGTHKFRNFKHSAWALRRINDQICLTHGLSIVENPKPSKRQYEKYTEKKPPSEQDKLRWAIDEALAKRPKDFYHFIQLVEEQGYIAKRGKHLKFTMTGKKKGTRCDTLKGDYTEEAIRERIEGTRIVQPWVKRKQIVVQPKEEVNLLIDIQRKIQQGKGAGYDRWAKLFNLKQAAKTLLFLQENNLTNYDELDRQATEASRKRSASSAEISKIDAQLSENAKLQKQIMTYTKTREIYTAYRKAGYSKKYLADHERDILLHKSAKAAFDRLDGKIPKVATLREEYDDLLKQKKALLADLNIGKQKHRELLTAKANVDLILGKPSILSKLANTQSKISNSNEDYEKRKER